MTTDPDASAQCLVQHGYARVGDVSLHYAESGSAPALVVLLHGFPECWFSWRHQLVALGEQFHVVAPDLRGYNLSERPIGRAAYRLEALARDILGLMEHFGSVRAAVVGHDWGAVLAWHLALRHPARVSRVAALQVPPPTVWRRNFHWRQAARSAYLLAFQVPGVAERLLAARDYALLRRMLRRSSPRGTFSAGDLGVYASAWRRPGALTAGLSYYRANLSSLARPASDARVRVPSLFLYGERDPWILPATVRGTAATIAAPYTEVRFPRAGHWLQLEEPGPVTAALREFLATS
ncbi:MAG: alpha/beta fold hydrolase [Gemmatimonadota bacterium]